MKARLFTNFMRSGHIARDFIQLALADPNSAPCNARPNEKAACAVLESLEDQDRSLPVDPVVPIKSLVIVLTESLQGIPVADTDGGISGARLYRGCPVRLRGLPERRFIIRDIYWDYEEVRVLELGTEVYYLVPWDCLQFDEEQER